MKIVCDNCSTKYSIADEKVRGKVFKIKCKKCSHIIVVKGEVVAQEGQGQGFDQKDTRVFDYSGFAGGRDGGGAAQDAIWHLVIDREQVGPLTLVEVQAKWDKGEVDGETYVWREGFADWQRLGAVDELASLTRSRDEAKGLFGKAAAPVSVGEGPADLFGTPRAEEGPSDLFAAERTPSATPEAAVFSSTGRTKPAKSEDLFGGEAMAAAPSDRLDTRPKMTAQRNENSVLFSLNNLASLATDSPKASSSSAAQAGAAPSGSIVGSTGTEGSGLIDIRAMAAMTLGSEKKEKRPEMPSSSDDDLPVFSASAFSAPASGVLLPTAPAAQSNRLMYMLVGFVAVLALAAIGLVVFILMGQKKETPAVALQPPTPQEVPVKEAGVTPPAPTPPAPTPPGPKPSPTPGVNPGLPPAQPPPPPPVATPNKPTERPGVKPPEKKPTEKPKEPTVRAPEKPAEPAPPPAAAKQPKCDEVACLVTPDLPCCPKKGGDRPREAAAAPAASGLADKLDEQAIKDGMKAVSGRVSACNDTYRVGGAFKVKVTVSPDGSVSAVSAQPPMAGTPTGTCVEKAVRGARFRKTKNPITFNYPYSFR